MLDLIHNYGIMHKVYIEAKVGGRVEGDGDWREGECMCMVVCHCLERNTIIFTRCQKIAYF